MTFPRNDPHEVLVQQIQEALTALGWCVEPMGQEQFSAPMQENLHNCCLPDGRPLPFRWLPDLLATRPPHAYFIDAKSSETWRQTGDHALEQNALAAALNWTAIWEMDVWYIFTDGSGTTARQLAKPSAKWPGPQRGNGSGTPFWLFPVGLTTPWEQLPFTNPPSKPKLCPSPDLGLKRAGFEIRLFGQPHENRSSTTASRCAICAMDPRGSGRGAISSGLGQSRERD